MNKKWNKVIGWYELLGGLLGIGLTVFVTYSSFISQPFGLLTVIVLAVLGLYSFSCVAGLLLIKGKEIGKTLSIINQVIQIPHFSVAGVTYFFVSGAMLSIMFRSAPSIRMNFKAYLGSTFNIDLMSENQAMMIGFNVLAMIVLVFLLKQRQPKLELPLNENLNNVNDRINLEQ